MLTNLLLAVGISLLSPQPQLDDVATEQPAEDDYAPPRLTPWRAQHVNLRTQNGLEIGTAENPIYINGQSELLSPLPGFVARSNRVIPAGSAYFQTYTMAQDIALVDFHFGGKGIGQSSLLRVNENDTQFVPGGGFNSNADVALWTDTSQAGAVASWAYTTLQAFEGTGSVATTFAKSDQNNYPEITYTWATAQDLSLWRYINARARVTVAAGGNQSRTIMIILTDANNSTRTYSLSGTTTTPPFNSEQWNQILGEIANPVSQSGTFDVYNVKKISLRLQDGGNKSGTIYWDDVRLISSMSLIERIYINANTSFQLNLNPVELFSAGEVLGILFRNNDVTSKEFTAIAKGVIP